MGEPEQTGHWRQGNGGLIVPDTDVAKILAEMNILEDLKNFGGSDDNDNTADGDDDDGANPKPVSVATGTDLVNWLAWAAGANRDLDIVIANGTRLVYDHTTATVVFVSHADRPPINGVLVTVNDLVTAGSNRPRFVRKAPTPTPTCRFYSPPETLVAHGAELAADYPYDRPMPFPTCTCPTINEAGGIACGHALRQTGCQFYQAEAPVVLSTKRGRVDELDLVATVASQRMNTGIQTWIVTLSGGSETVEQRLSRVDGSSVEAAGDAAARLLEAAGVTTIVTEKQTGIAPVSAFLRELVADASAP